LKKTKLQLINTYRHSSISLMAWKETNSRQWYLKQNNIYIIQEEARESQTDSNKPVCWAVQQQTKPDAQTPSKIQR